MGDHLYHREQGPPIDDAAAEALLAGGETTPDLEQVAGFVRALRESARRRVRPTASLAARMASGRPGGPGGPRVRAALEPGRPLAGGHPAGRGGPGRHRVRAPYRLVTVRLLAWAGAVGLVAAVLGTTTAGFARVLPEPAQGRFDTVVGVVTGYEIGHPPDEDGSLGAPPTGAHDGPAAGERRPAGPGGDGRTGGGEWLGPRTGTVAGGAGGTGGQVTAPGRAVRDLARAGAADGEAVSSAARRHAGGTAGTEPADGTGTSDAGNGPSPGGAPPAVGHGLPPGGAPPAVPEGRPGQGAGPEGRPGTGPPASSPGQPGA